MKRYYLPCCRRPATAAVLLATLCFTATTHALLFTNFSEFGSFVNGYQDDFLGSTLNPDWLEFDGATGGGIEDDPDPLFTLSGTGTLLMHAANGDPNKLLYNPALPYDDIVQEVLALIRVTNDPLGNTDGFRGGVTTTSDLFSGQGYNLHFREPGQPGGSPFNNHFNLLNDQIAWGPPSPGNDWTMGTYKWLRVRRELDADGVNDVFGKVWDPGTTAEPTNWTITWNRDDFRSGLAGLVTNSIGGQAELEVDYVLIKAAGLPSIRAVPEPSSVLLLGLAGAVLGIRRRRQ